MSEDLGAFFKKENEKEKDNTTPQVEWDGKDYRGERCYPLSIRYMRQHPLVFKWLRNRPRNSIENGCQSLRKLCDATKITPVEFVDLDRKKARDLAWEYIDSIRRRTPGAAIVAKNNINSFYYYHTDEKLVFHPQKHKIGYELQKIKEHMGKETCWKIIGKAITLRDEAILTVDFESGLRKNAISHMTYGHYKNFLWFRKEESGTIIPSDEGHGNIALFKVVPTQNEEYTHDNKLKGKKINWYYGCLHKEATTVLKKYVTIHHKDSTNNTPLFFPMRPLNKNKVLNATRFYQIFKYCVERAGLDPKKYSFKELRRGFRGVVRNTSKITDNEFKEAIMGHKLKGSQENYFDKDPLEFARQYAECDFSLPTPMKDRELEKLRKQVARYEEAIEKSAVTAELKIKPLRPEATREEILKAFNEFNEPSEESTTQPGIIKSNIPSEQTKSSETEKREGNYFTCQQDRKAYDFKELPCMANPLLNCSNKVCEKQVLERLI